MLWVLPAVVLLLPARQSRRFGSAACVLCCSIVVRAPAGAAHCWKAGSVH